MNAPPAAQVMELFAGVDDLIRRVADTENPEIRKVRARVYSALVVARSAYDHVAHQVHVQSQPAAGTAAYPQDDQGPVLGVALLVGLGLGLVVSLR
ncbi:MAG: hypothetical protein WBF89_23650 [Steroidobacteraceae bacterium]